MDTISPNDVMLSTLVDEGIEDFRRVFGVENYIRNWIYNIIMATETVIIPKEEYRRLKKFEQVDQDLLKDIASGIKDILEGKVKEV